MVERQVEIKASTQDVWQMFADMDRWLDWDPDFGTLESVKKGLVDDGGMVVKLNQGFRGTVTFSEVKEHE